MAMSREETLQQIRGILVEALGVDEDEVGETVTLAGDLGAESIDFLDIAFRLEKTFSIKIPRGELFPPEEVFNNPDYVEDGRMTPAGLAKLKEAMPHADFSDFEGDPTLERMPELFTVGTIVNYIERKLQPAA